MLLFSHPRSASAPRVPPVRCRADRRRKPCCQTVKFGNSIPKFLYSHSAALVLASHHSSCAQFPAPPRNACRRVTRRRASSASGAKAGTVSKTHFKLRALGFRFCPKGHGGPPLEARWRRKRPLRSSTALSRASRRLSPASPVRQLSGSSL